MDITAATKRIVEGLRDYRGEGGFLKHTFSNFSCCKELGVNFFISGGNVSNLVVPVRNNNSNESFLDYIQKYYLPIDYKKLFQVSYEGRLYDVFEIEPSDKYKAEGLNPRYIGDFICFVGKYLFEGNYRGYHNILDKKYVGGFTGYVKVAAIYKFLFENFNRHLKDGSINGIKYSTFANINSGLFSFIHSGLGSIWLKPIEEELFPKYKLTIIAEEQKYLDDVKLVCGCVSALINSLHVGVKDFAEYEIAKWALDPEIELKLGKFNGTERLFYSNNGTKIFTNFLAYTNPQKIS